MIGATDYLGLAAVITAGTGGLASIIAAIFSGRASNRAGAAQAEVSQVHQEVKVNGGGKTIGTAVDEVHAAVSTPPDAPPLGVVVTDTNDTVNRVEGRTPSEGVPKVET